MQTRQLVLLASLAAGCGRLGFDHSRDRADAPVGTADTAMADVRSIDGPSAFETLITDGHLVGYWKLDDTTWSDSSTYAHSGACVYGCPGLATGVRGQAADFHDLEGIEIGFVSPISSLATTFTLAGWVKLRSLTTYGVVISNDRDCSNCGTTSGFSLWSSLYGGAPTALLWNQSMTTFGPVGPSQLPLDTWVFLATTYDVTTSDLYVNGTLVGSVTGANKVGLPHSYPLRIGHQGFDYSGGTDGLIDEVMVFDRALSATEIGVIYNALKP